MSKLKSALFIVVGLIAALLPVYRMDSSKRETADKYWWILPMSDEEVYGVQLFWVQGIGLILVVYGVVSMFTSDDGVELPMENKFRW